jgi:DNA-binding beta-propeller fold protein YncE
MKAAPFESGFRLPLSRLTLAALSVAVIASSAASIASAIGERPGDTIWVANRDQGTVMAFDAITGAPVMPVIPVGPGAHDIVYSRKTDTVFVSDDASRVYVVSVATGATVQTIQFAAGSRPHHLSVSHDGHTVFVGLFATNTIAAIDTDSYAVRQLPSSLQAGVTAHAPEPSSDGRFVFVPHEGQNLVSMVSERRGVVEAEVNPGPAATSSPSEVLPTRDGKTLFVSMRNEGRVRVIDLDTFTVSADFVQVGTQPETLILAPGERTLIVSLRGSPARLAFVDTDAMQLEGTLDLAGTGSFGDLAAASPDGRYVYATFDRTMSGQGGVAKVDIFERTVVDTFLYSGNGRPHGIAYVPGRGRGH